MNHVEYDEPEFDRQLGAPGLHRISGPVRHEPRRTVRPPDLFQRFDALTFWDNPAGSAAWRIAPEPTRGDGTPHPAGTASQNGKTSR